jgi:transposase-like protein
VVDELPGATVAGIARRFGISPVRVSQILDRDGW